MDEQTEEGKARTKITREEDIKNAFLMGIPTQHFLMTHINIKVKFLLGDIFIANE